MTDSIRTLLPGMEVAQAWWSYSIDAMQRSVLFMDVLRQRGNQYHAHNKAGQPPVLTYSYKVLVDGHTLEHPVNYDLLQIDTPEGCTTDDSQRPFVAMLASVEPELLGPIVLNGAPLSYWAGVEGKNPMRYLGGLWGGTWITSMMADLGNGQFDGAYLVNNFESLNPANTLVSKPYRLYSKVDTEAERFLNFERWWNGFFLMTTEEMEFIVDNLFVGNRLEANQVDLGDGRRVSLRNIRSPIIIFASDGDNITPPQQALNWITDVFPTDEALLRDHQVIVYTLHPDVGHLGIFVSGRVARREHTVIVGVMDVVERLPPGLYEMVIDAHEEEGRRPDDSANVGYDVRFLERSVDDIRALDTDAEADEENFPALAAVSELGAHVYRTLGRPWVKALASKTSARFLRESLPSRAQHTVFSNRNPWMWPLALMSRAVKATRMPVSRNNPFVVQERALIRMMEVQLDTLRDIRDTQTRHMFNMLYGPMGLGGLFAQGPNTTAHHAPSLSPEAEAKAVEALRQLRSAVDQGGFLEGFARVLYLLSQADADVEPRAFVELDRVMDHHPRFKEVDHEALHTAIVTQAMQVKLDREAALATLPGLLTTPEERSDALTLARRVVLFDDIPNAYEKVVLEELDAIL